MENEASQTTVLEPKVSAAAYILYTNGEALQIGCKNSQISCTIVGFAYRIELICR